MIHQYGKTREICMLYGAFGYSIIPRALPGRNIFHMRMGAIVVHKSVYLGKCLFKFLKIVMHLERNKERKA